VRRPGRIPPRGAVLVLHGGRSTSLEPTTAGQLAVLRVAALAASLRRQLAGEGIAVAFLRFSVRGWNGTQASPVADAVWALDRLDSELGVPLAVVGHSMGGRTAIRVAGHASVRGVVALAPWLPAGEPVEQLADRVLLIGHGTRDRVTDPADSARFAARARAVAAGVTMTPVDDGHALLRHPGFWDRYAADGVRSALGTGVPR
jgi:dienelactone hydrolase